MLQKPTGCESLPDSPADVRLRVAKHREEHQQTHLPPGISDTEEKVTRPTTQPRPLLPKLELQWLGASPLNPPARMQVPAQNHCGSYLIEPAVFGMFGVRGSTLGDTVIGQELFRLPAAQPFVYQFDRYA